MGLPLPLFFFSSFSSSSKDHFSTHTHPHPKTTLFTKMNPCGNSVCTCGAGCGMYIIVVFTMPLPGHCFPRTCPQTGPTHSCMCTISHIMKIGCGTGCQCGKTAAAPATAACNCKGGDKCSCAGSCGCVKKTSCGCGSGYVVDLSFLCLCVCSSHNRPISNLCKELIERSRNNN